MKHSLTIFCNYFTTTTLDLCAIAHLLGTIIIINIILYDHNSNDNDIIIIHIIHWYLNFRLIIKIITY
jgi:hypothetical protein